LRFGSNFLFEEILGSVTNSVIMNNTATVSGGGLYLEDGVSFSIVNCNFSGNIAANGGAIATLSEVSITNSSIFNNFASLSGGGMWLDGATYVVNVSNTKITQNRAANVGGGVSLLGGQIFMQGVTISQNWAGNYGGGVFATVDAEFVTNATSVIQSSTITLNNATLGGGIFLNIGSLVNIVNCMLSNNTALTDGGGIYCNGSTSEMNGTVVSYNSALNGTDTDVYCDSNCQSKFCFKCSCSACSDCGSGSGCSLSNSAGDSQCFCYSAPACDAGEHTVCAANNGTSSCSCDDGWKGDMCAVKTLTQLQIILIAIGGAAFLLIVVVIIVVIARKRSKRADYEPIKTST